MNGHAMEASSTNQRRDGEQESPCHQMCAAHDTVKNDRWNFPVSKKTILKSKSLLVLFLLRSCTFTVAKTFGKSWIVFPADFFQI